MSTPVVTPFRVCLLVPAGAWRIEPLAQAIRDVHPHADIVAAWAGDPHRRPALPTESGVRWADDTLAVEELSGIGWDRLLVALQPRCYEWAVAAATVAQMLDRDPASVVLLRVGSVAVLDHLEGLWSPAPFTLVPLALDGLPTDGRAPSEADVVARGRFSTVAARFGAGAQPALRWLGRQLVQSDDPTPGRWVERMAELFGGDRCENRGIGVGPWRTTLPLTPALLDLDELDRVEPWHFTFSSGPARLRLSEHPEFAAAVEKARPQVEGFATVLRFPGDVDVDQAMRALMRRAVHDWQLGAAELPPAPFGPQQAAFVRWLETPEPAGPDLGRYWMELHRQRADLQVAFPRVTSVDAAAYRVWTEASWRLERRSVLLQPSAGTPVSIASAGHDPAGINVLGYLDFDQSQGHIARNLIAAFRAAHVPVRALNHHRSLGSPRPVPIAEPREATFATNLVVVNADQFEFVVADHGDTLLKDRHTIGYWFWELEHVPAPMVRACSFVQEIWAGSQFIADAFAAVTDTPVACVPLPVIEPQPSARDRASFGLPTDRFIFLATFDQFSVPERKNPFGVIAAFMQAFAENEGPLLWIKTMNGAKGWRQHERLLLATANRRDIVVWDEHLSRPDQMAVLNAADCLVSLHRSEGLGLHCAEAMWLSKPVIATRYSGNLDFMDDTCSALIDYTMVPVRHGEGIYPDEAMWAEPSVEQAAEWMRRLAGDQGLADELGRAGRARMQQQPSLAEAGHAFARRARLERGESPWGN